jgi:hypothetical protein
LEPFWNELKNEQARENKEVKNKCFESVTEKEKNVNHLNVYDGIGKKIESEKEKDLTSETTLSENKQEQTAYQKLLKVPPLKIFNLPTTHLLPLKLFNPNATVEISSFNITINPKSVQSGSLLGKRQYCELTPSFKNKNLGSPQSEMSHFSKTVERKNTVSTCDLKSGINAQKVNDSENCFDNLFFKDVPLFNSKKKNFKIEKKIKNDFSIKMHSEKNLMNNKIEFLQNNALSEKCEKNNTIDNNCTYYSRKNSTNSLDSLLRDIIKTTDNMPKTSECRLKLMSLVKKYQTANLKSLI